MASLSRIAARNLFPRPSPSEAPLTMPAMSTKVTMAGTISELFESKEIVPAMVTFVDIAGIVKGASEGEGLGNKFLAAIRESDAICQVVRVFTNPDVIHVDGKIAPGDD